MNLDKTAAAILRNQLTCKTIKAAVRAERVKKQSNMQLKVFLVVSVLAALQLGSARVCQSNVPTLCVEIKMNDPDSGSGYYWIQSGSLLVQRFCDFSQCDNPVGFSQDNPAASCNQVKEQCLGIISGDYWIENSLGQVMQVYCNMELTCGNVTGGWMRVADIDMRDPSDSCPSGLNETTINSTRVCAMNYPDRCSSTTISTHDVQYSHVCGKIIGYQQRTPDAFGPYQNNPGLTIDEGYVDGIILTYGQSPRKHIWTFVAATEEELCSCNEINAPLFIGNNYFCEAALNDFSGPESFFYRDDPLWDGKDCGPLNTCCPFNNPPWFSKQLTPPTTDDIEMRLCADEARNNEGITFEQVELYVQ